MVTKEMEEIIANEYKKLCNDLDLEPVELVIYQSDIVNDRIVKYNVQYNYLDHLYGFSNKEKDVTILAIPLDEYEVDNFINDISYPPKLFNKISNQWPIWREGLWHETMHQVQHRKLNKWDPSDKENDGGKEGREEAIKFMSEQLKIKVYDLKKVIY